MTEPNRSRERRKDPETQKHELEKKRETTRNRSTRQATFLSLSLLLPRNPFPSGTTSQPCIFPNRLPFSNSPLLPPFAPIAPTPNPTPDPPIPPTPIPVPTAPNSSEAGLMRGLTVELMAGEVMPWLLLGLGEDEWDWAWWEEWARTRECWWARWVRKRAGLERVRA